MRAWALVAASLVALGQAQPRLDPDDARFFDFRAPVEGDCEQRHPIPYPFPSHPRPSLRQVVAQADGPGQRAARARRSTRWPTTDGFLPTSWRGINLTDIILAAFHGYGVAPETSALITADGLAASGSPLDLVFRLEDLQLASWAIEHDSFSRPDRAEDPTFPFDAPAWDDVANALAGCDAIGPRCMGRAKAARLDAQRPRGHGTAYTRSAAAHGAAEVGMLLDVLSTARSTADRLLFIRSLFENEAIPRHLGWEPREFLASVETAIDLGVASLVADPAKLQQADDGQVVTRGDIIQAIKPPNGFSAQEIVDVIRNAGFTDRRAFAALSNLDLGL